MKELYQYLGVDGFLYGWISVELYTENKLEIRQFSTIGELWKEYNKVKLILIDIPIGLRDKGSLPRLCDIAAESFLRTKDPPQYSLCHVVQQFMLQIITTLIKLIEI